jgi:hypothetical protein
MDGVECVSSNLPAYGVGPSNVLYVVGDMWTSCSQYVRQSSSQPVQCLVLQETTKPLNFGQIPYQSLNKVQVPHHPLIFLKFLNIPRSYFSFLTS